LLGTLKGESVNAFRRRQAPSSSDDSGCRTQPERLSLFVVCF
jgi:hypothetical protein